MMNENLIFLKKHGLKNFLIIFYYRVLTNLYNKKYNLETNGIPLEKLDKSRAPKSIRYFDTGTESIVVPSIRSILKNLTISPDDIIIDMGSGQGRFLFVASEFKFKEIIGVEFLDYLYKISLNNLKNFSIKNQNNISIKNSDILDYVFKGKENFFYFYNPFDCRMMRLVIKKIKDEIKINSRKVTIIYVSPKCHQVLEDFDFKLVKKIKLVHKICHIYTN